MVALKILHYTTKATIPLCIYKGIEVLTKEYLVNDYKEHDAQRGVVEVLFDKLQIDRLMSHEGAHLLVGINDRREISSKPVVGLSIFYTNDSDFPSEAENIVCKMSACRPLAWWFYVIIHVSLRDGFLLRRLVNESLRIMTRENCIWVAADYMIRPVLCSAGKRLMDMAGFEDTGMEYGNGLKGLGKDVYRIMLRKIQRTIGVGRVET